MTTTARDAVLHWLGPANTDHDDDGVLADLVEVATAPLVEVEQAVRALDGRPGWAVVMDPETSPALRWLAQFVGVRLHADLPEDRQRLAIVQRPYHRRGTVEAIKAAGADWLLEGTVVLRERDGSAYRLTIDYFAARVDQDTWDDLDPADTWEDLDADEKWSDLPDSEELLVASLLAAVPVGIVPTVRKLHGATYGDLNDDFATVGDFVNDPDLVTNDDVRTYIPKVAG